MLLRCLKKNYGGFEKIIEQLMDEIRLPKQMKASTDIQEFSNLVELSLFWKEVKNHFFRKLKVSGSSSQKMKKK
jgi:hypothetical protein